MVRTAALIGLGLFASTASAQTTKTTCSKDYFGNVTCTSTQQPGVDWTLGMPQQRPAPVDQGAILQSGAGVVPPYRPSPRPVVRNLTPEISQKDRAAICQQSFDKAISDGNYDGAERVAKICGLKGE